MEQRHPTRGGRREDALGEIRDTRTQRHHLGVRTTLRGWSEHGAPLQNTRTSTGPVTRVGRRLVEAGKKRGLRGIYGLEEHAVGCGTGRTLDI